MAIKAYLVEDQPDISSTLIEGMEEVMPVQFVGQAANESEALHWLRDNRHAWDVLIIDLRLRKGSGFGVLQACKTRRAQQKAVVLTSYVDDKVLAQCRAMGADAVFDKNDQLEQLVTFCLDHAEDLGKAAHATPTDAPPDSTPPASAAHLPLETAARPHALPKRSRLTPWRNQHVS